MKKILLVICLATTFLLVSCGPSNDEPVADIETSEDSQLEESGGSDDSEELLSFDCTPSEFHTLFSGIANKQNIATSELDSTSSLTSFNAEIRNGESVWLHILSNPDGKISSIDISFDNFGEKSIPVIEIAIMSISANLTYDSVNAELDFEDPPSSITDAKATTQGGLYFMFTGDRLSITRDTDTQNEYQPAANSNSFDELPIDGNSASNHSDNSSTTATPSESNTSADDGNDTVSTTSGGNNTAAKPSGNNGTTTEPQSSDTPDNSPSENTGSETSGQKNALSKAHSYLNALPFSYSGLINQLEYEGFSTEEATYAADNCGANWTEQALKKAKNYLDTLPYSYSGLIEQLEYEGFTTAEATYGADNCSADWNEQAAKKAQSYLDVMAFSRDELISQLEYEGFTPEQAEYGVTAVGY